MNQNFFLLFLGHQYPALITTQFSFIEWSQSNAHTLLCPPKTRASPKNQKFRGIQPPSTQNQRMMLNRELWLTGEIPKTKGMQSK
jgi:hypothetical protein